MRQFCTLFFVFGLLSNIFAQTAAPNHWTPVALDAVALPATAERLFEPKAYTAFTLDYDALVAQLALAPMEFTYEAGQKSCIVQIPQADGTLETFAVAYTQVMAPGLAARYPEIRTYSGESLTTPNKLIRITTGPYHGLNVMITRPDKGIEYVEPVAKGQNLYYMAYDRLDFPNELRINAPTLALPSVIDLSEKQNKTLRFSPGEPVPQDRGTLLNPVVLKVYQFAAATTGEFSQDNGGTTAAVLQKVTTVNNNLNAIYERDLAVRLQLIEEEDQILYLNPATDPYTGTSVQGWLGQNPLAMLMGLGNNDKYDIGHVFARYMGGSQGVGQLGVCCTDFKGRGCSAGSIPYGDAFFSIIGQEIGHQWDALHTWNSCGGLTEPFPDTERCEPGSGSTIMSYGGLCGGDNVQGDADLYYHACSIFKIRSFVEDGNGKFCGQNISTGNNPPVVTIAHPDNFFIPISTPFELTGSATDPDGDAVTYGWDEVDLGPLVPLGTAQGSSPLFRSFPPSSNPARTFPRLQSIIFNTNNDAELLPDYSRDLTFCLVARDDKPGGGGIGFDTVAFRATAQAGPFVVTYPNSNSDIWTVGEYRTITWDVANTDKAPVNCKTVNIRLSVNNGLVNQVLLASGVPNNGKYCIQVPNNISNIARVRVEAADNVFFDISNAGFKIQAASAQPDFSFCPSVLADFACAPTAYTTEISTNAIAGFNDPITLEATGLPAGATATFSPNPVTPGTASTLTVDFTSVVTEGPFDLTVSATANGNTKTSAITFTVVQNDFSAFALQLPADGAQSVDLAPWLYWDAVADADKYEIQVASNPSFAAGTILASNSSVAVDSFKIPFLLAEGQVCYWRARPKNDCGSAAWSEPFVFVTKIQSCTSLAANDLPKTISANGTPTVESKITVSGSGVVGDVNVKKVQGNHSFMQDLEVRLISPAGTNVLLFLDKCGSYSGNFNIGFDDSANGRFNCPPPINGSLAKPAGQLSNFIGQNSAGVWTLRVKDNVISSGGKLEGFELELCSNVALNAPFIVNNNTLQVVPGTNAVIGENLLKVEDPNNSASQLIFTLVTVPKFGDLRLTGNSMQPGDQFTQADINSGLLRYYEYGFNAGTDNFKFSVTDGEGGLVNGTFDILPFPVDTKEPLGNIAFDLAPNPASESVRLFVSQPLDSDSRVALFNTAGQLLRFWTLPAGAPMLLLDVADLPEGVYAVAVENEKGRGVRKVVVQ